MKKITYSTAPYRSFIFSLAGKVRLRSHPEYTCWLQEVAWNQRNFGRLPKMIVRANTLEDIVNTVKFARYHKHSISVRSGGHSYCGCFLHNNCILLDISALNDIHIEPDNALAQVGPGVTARELTRQLKNNGLAFPTGHSGEVAIGGFLLGGGMGINTTAWGGMSVFNIEAMDIITADGQLYHASLKENTDLFWAARGSGPNAFFIVVRFYLKCYPIPKAIANHIYQLPYSALKTLLTVLEENTWDPRLQIMIGLKPPIANHPHTLILNTIAFTDNDKESLALQQSLIEKLPSDLITVVIKKPNSSFDDIYQQSDNMMVGQRFRSDNIVTNHILDVVRIIDLRLPTQPSPEGITLIVWRGEQHFPDAAYSVKGRFFVSTYLQWDKEQDDDINRQWLISLYNKLTEFSCGSYINEFDLEARSEQVESCYQSNNWQRLCEIRQRFDPSGVFVNIQYLLDK